MSNCPRCGGETSGGAFCGDCGARLEPPVVRRAAGSPFLARIDGPVPEGMRIAVADDDSFHGLRHGAVAVSVKKGEHTVAEGIEVGWFLHLGGLEIPFEEHLGLFEDARGAKHEVAMRGVARFRIDEPADFLPRLEEAFDAASVSAQVRSKLKELVDEEIRRLLARGRYFTTLHSTKAIDEMRSEIRAKYAGDAARDPATSLDIEKLQLGTAALEDATSQPAVEPAPSREGNAGFAAGARVTATWPDGRRFSGVVVGTYCRVAFDGGEEQWVPMEALTPSES